MWFGVLWTWVASSVARLRVSRDRGDVPGWVMVTMMSAVLVVVILGVFEPQIKDALSGIIDSVSGSGK